MRYATKTASASFLPPRTHLLSPSIDRDTTHCLRADRQPHAQPHHVTRATNSPSVTENPSNRQTNHQPHAQPHHVTRATNSPSVTGHPTRQIQHHRQSLPIIKTKIETTMAKTPPRSPNRFRECLSATLCRILSVSPWNSHRDPPRCATPYPSHFHDFTPPEPPHGTTAQPSTKDRACPPSNHATEPPLFNQLVSQLAETRLLQPISASTQLQKTLSTTRP